MIAKILVGLIAAALVAGGGIYYAFSGSSCDHGCTGTADVVVSEGASCCSKGCCSGDDEAECSEPKACSADAAGACLGSAAVTAKKSGCCEE